MLLTKPAECISICPGETQNERLRGITALEQAFQTAYKIRHCLGFKRLFKLSIIVIFSTEMVTEQTLESCFLFYSLAALLEKSRPDLTERRPLISLNNSHACVDLIR